MSSSEEDSDSDEKCPIVIDNGSTFMKCGFAGDDAARVVFPPCIGRPKVKNTLIGMMKDFYVGDEAQSKRGILHMKRPMENGVITDWDDMEKIWHHCFHQELRVDPSELNVLLTDNGRAPESRAKMTEIMFEKFSVPGMYIGLESVMALYASGRVTGVVVNSGYETTTITPIYEGTAVPHATKCLDVGGNQIAEYLAQLLTERGYCITTSYEKEMLNDVKEKLCYLSLDPSAEKEIVIEQNYEICDGPWCTLREERYMATEPLFNPGLIGSEDSGLHQQLNDSIMKCFPDPHPKHFYPNIVLCGGNSMFDGFKERLHKEVTQVMSPAMVAKVIAPPERKYSAWIGGSIFASLASNADKWLTSDEYEEVGPSIADTKFPVTR